ncbi:MAG: S41 family peptidase [Acidobacteriota bacterium]
MTRIALLLALMVGGSFPFPSAEHPQEDFKRLVDEAWKTIDETYYDSTFNNQNWPRVRAELLARNYSSRQEAVAAIREMIKRLDEPATRFLTRDEFAALLNDFSTDQHAGIGLKELLSVDINERTRRLTVVTPLPESPAARARLRPGDIIEAIDGLPTAGLSLAEAAAKLRGEAGTGVNLRVRRGRKIFDLPLRREIIPAITPVRSFMKVLSPVRALEDISQRKKIGYIALRQFTAEASSQMREAVKNLLQKGADGFLLDLRNNPGGLVDACQQIAGVFLDKKLIAYISSKGARQELAATGERMTDKLLVAIINEGSASAAEVLAAALQSNKRASLVGARTFGKGLLHFPRPLADGSAMLVTAGKLLTPDGRDILSEGILPDVPEPSAVIDSTKAGSSEDVQYARALGILLREIQKR